MVGIGLEVDKTFVACWLLPWGGAPGVFGS